MTGEVSVKYWNFYIVPTCFKKNHIKLIVHARMRSKWAYVRRYNVINSQLEKIVKDHHSRTLPSLTAEDNSSRSYDGGVRMSGRP